MKKSEIAIAYDKTVSRFSRRLPHHDQITELGVHYFKSGRKDVAAGYFALAAAMSPNDSNPKNLVGLGISLQNRGQLRSAVACFQSALESGGPNPQISSKRDHCIKEMKPGVDQDELAALRWDTDHYFVGRQGKDLGENGSLVLWVAPFAGKSGTVTSNLLNTFSEFLEADVIVMNAWAFGYELDIYPDIFLYCLAVDLAPDVVFYLNPSLSQSPKNPRLETISWMRQLTGAALVTLCLDLAKPYYRNAVNLLAGESDLVVTTDQPAGPELTARANGRVMLGWHVVDTATFMPRGQDRDIDVSFVGQFHGKNYVSREPFLTHLNDNGVELFLGGSSAGKFLSNDEYADVMRRSRIALNFSGFEVVSGWDVHLISLRSHQNHCEKNHLKARVFEILESGALLFESENSVITEWFEPGVHYVPFSDKGDLLDKVRYYLAKEDERQKIALAGRLFAREQYTPEKFWHGVFDPLIASGQFRRLPAWRSALDA